MIQSQRSTVGLDKSRAQRESEEAKKSTSKQRDKIKQIIEQKTAKLELFKNSVPKAFLTHEEEMRESPSTKQKDQRSYQLEGLSVSKEKSCELRHEKIEMSTPQTEFFNNRKTHNDFKIRNIKTVSCESESNQRNLALKDRHKQTFAERTRDGKKVSIPGSVNKSENLILEQLDRSEMQIISDHN